MVTPPSRLAGFAFVLALCWPAALRAQTATTGARSEAMAGAALTDVVTNAAIYANPAAMGEMRRYSLDLGYLLDRKKDNQMASISIVDTTMSSLGAGFSYTYFDIGTSRVDGSSRVGHRVDLALSYPFVQSAFIGAGAHYLKEDIYGKPKGVNAATVDAGIYYRLHPMISAGFVGYNLIDVRSNEAPLSIGTGVSLGAEGAYVAKFDWLVDFATDEKASYSYRAGAEYVAAKVLPIRAGFSYDDRRGSRMADASLWSVGAGLCSTQAALEFAFSQAITGEKERQLVFGLRMILM